MRQRPTIGEQLVAQRAAGIGWKALTRKYGLSRARLYQLWQQAAGARKPPPRTCPNCGHALTRAS